MTPDNARQTLADLCISRGAVSFGVARLADVRTDDFLLPAPTLRDLPTAISIALRLAPAVLGTLEDHPNQLYEHHYRQVNFALDRLALDLATLIQGFGAQALPVRLVTVLTDLGLEPDRPLETGCGSCRACIAACPAKAIGENPAEFKHHDCADCACARAPGRTGPTRPTGPTDQRV